MTPQDDWDAIRSERAPLLGSAGMGMLRVALLFGSAAVALAMILAPIAANYTRPEIAGAEGIDMISTGSIGRAAYTIRRSVLQASPHSVCIIRANGQRSGDC